MNLYSASSSLLWPAPADWERKRMLVPLFTQMVEQTGKRFPILSLKNPLKKQITGGQESTYKKIYESIYENMYIYKHIHTKKRGRENNDTHPWKRRKRKRVVVFSKKTASCSPGLPLQRDVKTGAPEWLSRLSN